MSKATHNRAWEDVEQELLEGDPELQASFDESEPAYVVARELIRARTEDGLSQSEVARRMGTAPSVISRLERMDTSPTLKTVFALAKALDRGIRIEFVRAGAPADVKVDLLQAPPATAHGDIRTIIGDFVRRTAAEINASSEQRTQQLVELAEKLGVTEAIDRGVDAVRRMASEPARAGARRAAAKSAPKRVAGKGYAVKTGKRAGYAVKSGRKVPRRAAG